LRLLNSKKRVEKIAVATARLESIIAFNTTNRVDDNTKEDDSPLNS
jgi:hypothetical protein